jgi:predicted Zn-dependent protease
MQHLLGSQGASGMPAHAVSHHGQRHPAASRVRQQRDAILLFFAIPLMLGDAGVNHNGHVKIRMMVKLGENQYL